MDLYNDIQRKINELDISIRSLRKTGNEFAEAERNYKIKLREEALKLRSDEKMPVTLIQQTIYGVKSVADLRFQRDIKETMYKANLEAIQGIKLQIKILENQLDREWGNVK